MLAGWIGIFPIRHGNLGLGVWARFVFLILSFFMFIVSGLYEFIFPQWYLDSVGSVSLL